MIKKLLIAILLFPACLCAQINTERVMMIARNALYFEDYVLSIQYFNQVISAKPYLFEPYFYRGLAKSTWMTIRGQKPIAMRLSGATRCGRCLSSERLGPYSSEQFRRSD